MAREAIFVGYRRDDTADVAGRIYDAMVERFGAQRIFKDVDNIGPGVDFGDYIKTVLPKCRVALILIGPNWLGARDEGGARRLDNSRDWVRIEIETAMATRGLLVVPVLVNGASMPREEELPESLRPLLRRNATSIRRDPDFHVDVARLGKALKASVRTGVLDMNALRGARRWRAIGLVLALGIAVAAGLAYVWTRLQPAQVASIGSDAPVDPTRVMQNAQAWDAECFAHPHNTPIAAACSNFVNGDGPGREWGVARTNYCQDDEDCAGRARFVNLDQVRHCFVVAASGAPAMAPFCLAPQTDRIVPARNGMQFCVDGTSAQPCTGASATWVMVQK